MNITLEDIQKKFDGLPEDLKRAVMATDVDGKITSIGQTLGLNIEQLGELSLTTHMVILGYINPNNFEAELKNSLRLPEEKNKILTQEINTKILQSIREKIKISQTGKPEEEKYSITDGFGKEKNKNSPFTLEENKNINEKEIKKEEQNKKIMESISSRKLFGSFQSPTVKTEYTLNNLSKDKNKEGTFAKQDVKIPLGATIKPASSETKDTSPSYSIKEDPYRMKPE